MQRDTALSCQEVTSHFNLQADAPCIRPGSGAPHPPPSALQLATTSRLQSGGSSHTKPDPGVGRWNENDSENDSGEQSITDRNHTDSIQVVAEKTRRDRAPLTR